MDSNQKHAILIGLMIGCSILAVVLIGMAVYKYTTPVVKSGYLDEQLNIKYRYSVDTKNLEIYGDNPHIKTIKIYTSDTCVFDVLRTKTTDNCDLRGEALSGPLFNYHTRFDTDITIKCEITFINDDTSTYDYQLTYMGDDVYATKK
jgi:hypothetical protein